VLSKIEVPEFKPVDGVKIATTEAEAKEQGSGGGGGGQYSRTRTGRRGNKCPLLLGFFFTKT